MYMHIYTCLCSSCVNVHYNLKLVHHNQKQSHIKRNYTEYNKTRHMHVLDNWYQWTILGIGKILNMYLFLRCGAYLICLLWLWQTLLYSGQVISMKPFTGLWALKNSSLLWILTHYLLIKPRIQTLHESLHINTFWLDKKYMSTSSD